jgi:hypothetical protein
MRRTFAAALVALCATVTVLPALSTPATATGTPVVARAGSPGDATARDVLERARQVLASTQGSRRDAGRPGARRPDASLALRDLFLVRSRLDGDDRELADALLARPTDGADDPFGDGYSVPAKKKCKQNVCLHWVPSTADAPPSTKWAMKSLGTLNKVWKFEVGNMGYRRPPGDFGVGGNKRFDVYLKELGSRGVYGYCAPEYRVPGTKYVATSFCVLDNDFAKSQFGAPPTNSLRVTAAHEFFHAIQFGYDYHEDRWLFESTATWMEERYADPVNDNRQYLPAGQVGRPDIPLDTYDTSASTHYGNWAFWEFLTHRYGNGLVKSVWTKSAAFKGAPNMYSTKALKSVLAGRGGFPAVFRAYAAANVIANRTYAEGKEWPAAQLTRAFTLGKSSRRIGATTRIDHMAANHFVFRPGTSLKGKSWKLKVVVGAPRAKAGGAAYLIVKLRKGAWIKRAIPLNGRGIGTAKFTFTRNSVESAIVTLVNTSTNFRCWKDNPYFSCAGIPTGDNRKFKILGQVLKR